MNTPASEFSIRPIGYVRSPLVSRAEAPRQGSEGAPDAWLEIDERVLAGLDGIAVGEELIILTWFHQGRRDVLKLHPRGDPTIPLSGVFATRSPDRPNPIGLHRGARGRAGREQDQGGPSRGHRRHAHRRHQAGACRRGPLIGSSKATARGYHLGEPDLLGGVNQRRVSEVHGAVMVLQHQSLQGRQIFVREGQDLDCPGADQVPPGPHLPQRASQKVKELGEDCARGPERKASPGERIDARPMPVIRLVEQRQQGAGVDQSSNRRGHASTGGDGEPLPERDWRARDRRQRLCHTRAARALVPELPAPRRWRRRIARRSTNHR